jgi:hypothetical protein
MPISTKLDGSGTNANGSSVALIAIQKVGA